jgi:hypothetical protein
MSPKPLPLPRAAAFFASLYFLWRLQGPLCPGHPAVWHAEPQYHSHPQPEHAFNDAPGSWQKPHSGGKFGIFCCCFDDDMALLDFASLGLICALCCLALLELRCFDLFGFDFAFLQFVLESKFTGPSAVCKLYVPDFEEW